jgi:hypothetical protein
VPGVRFFEDEDMDFATRCVLSGVRHGMAEVGETLTTIARIDDGDPASWLDAFVALGRRLRLEADRASSAGHRYSAWNAALRAANYLYAGLWWAPATDRADEQDELWEEHRASWDLAVRHWPSPVRSVELPHRGARLPGWWFASPCAGPDPAPAVVLVQGLGTPISDVCMTGLDGALARGHHVLVFDGPGQGAALHRQGLHLDHGWPQLVADAIDLVAAADEVDELRVSLVGVGAGALFAAQAASLCGRRSDAARPAALVLDPPVVDLGEDAAAAVAGATDERARRLLAATTTAPTGSTDLGAAVEVLRGHRIDRAEIGAIGCPTLSVTADAAFGFRGQGAALDAALRCEHRGLVLRADDGAGADNGIDASQVHDAAVYDWLDATLVTDRATGPGQDGGPHG